MNQASKGLKQQGFTERSGAEIPCIPPAENIQARVAALNAALETGGFHHRVQLPASLPACLPNGPSAERERISIQLMAVLQESRDREAFELLYLLNARTLHLFCRSRLRVRYPSCRFLDPGDVVDEAFMNIYLRCQTFCVARSTSFTGWALVVAENVIRQDQRSRSRQVGRGLPLDDHLNEQLTDRRPGPQARAVHREMRASMEHGWGVVVRLCAAGILKLSPRWRQVLELREGEGLTYREIGQRLNLSRGHAGMLIRRARLKVLRQVRVSLDRYR